MLLKQLSNAKKIVFQEVGWGGWSGIFATKKNLNGGGEAIPGG